MSETLATESQRSPRQTLVLPITARNGRLMEIGCRQLPDGAVELTDLGETRKELYLSDVELVGPTREVFDILLGEYGAHEDDLEIRKRVDKEDLGRAAWAFITCLLKLEEVAASKGRVPTP